MPISLSWLGADVTFWSLGWLSLVYTRRKNLRSLFHIKFNKLNYLDDRYLQNCDEPWYCIECCSTSFPFNPYLAQKHPDLLTVFSFCEIKCYYVSGIQLPDCSKLAVNWKNGSDITILCTSSSFWFFVFLVKFSY